MVDNCRRGWGVVDHSGGAWAVSELCRVCGAHGDAAWCGGLLKHGDASSGSAVEEAP